MTDRSIKDYLLVAEADKIQDLIFRSAYLREVVGGSQLLTQFCQEIPSQIAPEIVMADDIITSDGGSFRIQFDNKDDAKDYGDKLAELYHHATGGSLTVTKPIETHGNFKAASEEAMLALRQAKQDRQDRIAVEQMPYMALCASCGIGLAKRHQKLVDDLLVDPQYLCPSCLDKAHARENAGVGEFLRPFYDAINYPKKVQRIPTPEDIGQLDARNYVAYIVADGNGMGDVFSKCTDSAKMADLSQALTPALRKSLAAPSSIMISHDEIVNFLASIKMRKEKEFVPVLPLIMGGDDIFVLLPAPWALDFALRFVWTYEKTMREIVKKIFNEDFSPSISAAVVICKASYPYYLAHRRGEELLSQAKQMGKRWGVENKANPRSTITFELILGNRIAGVELSGEENRPTLKPYWTHDAPEGWGLPMQKVLEQRFALADAGVSQKRLIQFRSLFDRLPPKQSGENGRKAFACWQKDCNQLLQRVKQRSEKEGRALQTAFDTLGGRDLYNLQRATDEEAWYGHGLPDLITAWDYTFDLSKSMADYEGGK